MEKTQIESGKKRLEFLVNIYNALFKINVSGNDTLVMSDTIRSLQAVIENYAADLQKYEDSESASVENCNKIETVTVKE